MLAENDYDLILMDVQMPVMNGIDATIHIRKKMAPSKSKIPIIALTASVLRADLDLCFQSGMTAYVPKPFKPWQLINTIAEVTGRDRNTTYANKNISNRKEQEQKEKQQQKGEQKKVAVKEQPKSEVKAAPSQDFSAYEQTGNVTNLDYLRKFCEGDEKRMKKYIKVYLNALPAFFSKIEAAIQTKDYVEIALHVHSFKPKWMMMGMKPTNELGIVIDQLCKSENETAFEHLKTLMDNMHQSLKELEPLV
jgi:response regulator RpfG family c-di-GMP phosphodiesterase